ncbi:MAG: hypothetical protein QXS00_07900 [Pyrobaculum sp.]
MNEVFILVLTVGAAAALIALGSPFVVDAAHAAWKISEYRALYVLPTIHVENGTAWLCFNKTAPVAAYNATDGRPLQLMHNCYKEPGHSCVPNKTPQHQLYCKAWLGPLRPGDVVEYEVRGNATSRTITIRIYSISVPPR